MNYNEFDRHETEKLGEISLDEQVTPVPAEKKRPKKRHGAGAAVAGMLAAVIVLGGGAGFGGAYLAGRSTAETTINSADSGNSGSENSSSNTSSGSTVLNEIQKDVSTPVHTATENVEFNSDGTYKYTRDLVSAVQDSIVYIEVFVNYRGKSTLYGSASGIIISKDGYIVTNNHVVENCDSFTVKVNNTDAKSGVSESKTYDATLCGTDEDTDLAVLKINANGLHAAALGDSDELHLGDDVIAIGNPLGLETSVSKGIVSGLNRQISDSVRGLSSIQTDAAINSGNSGGALFNGYGEVVGVVNEKYVEGYAESLGFAITINEAKDVIDDLISKGYVSGRAVLGITYTPVSEEIAAYTGRDAGWTVTEINSDMPVSKSGLVVGDTITEIDGVSVFDDNVMEVFTKKKPGDTVQVTVTRYDGFNRRRSVEITVELSESKG